MSGGHFDFMSSSRLNATCEQVDELIDSNNMFDENDYTRNYSDETLKRFEELKNALEKTSKMLHLVDYLVCGDIGEDDLHKDWPDA